MDVALRASFKGRIQLGSGKVRFEGALAVKPPDRLRLEISGPVGGRQAILIVRGEQLVMLLPRAREFINEKATRATYEAVLGMGLDTEGLIRLILSAESLLTAQADQARWIDLAPGSRLMLAREGAWLRASLEGEPEVSGFRSIELRLEDPERTLPGEFPEDLFNAEIPEGWSRLVPAGRHLSDPLLWP